MADTQLGRRDVLRQLAAAIEQTGWYPLERDFMSQDNQVTLRELIGSGAVDRRDEFLVLTGVGLREIRDDQFAAAELKRCADLLEYMHKRRNEKKWEPITVQMLLAEVLWKSDVNSVRRAGLLLWLETGAAVTLTTQGSHILLDSISVQPNWRIWEFKREDILNGKQPRASEQPNEPTGPLDANQILSQLISRDVFVVHGHDDLAKLEVARLLERLDLSAVILHEQANKGRTIIEKFEQHAENAAFAVILLTPDDVGRPKDGDSDQPRARQNVIFEAGYFIGRLGREKVVLLYKGVEKPSDLDGLLYIEMDAQGAWRMKVVREIAETGITLDPKKIVSLG